MVHEPPPNQPLPTPGPGGFGDSRARARRPLSPADAVVRKDGANHLVRLVNLSDGGAMVEAEIEAQLWDRVTLVLGAFGEIEAAVRWIRGDRIGLEFAQETRIDCDDETLGDLIDQAVRAHFPEILPADGYQSPVSGDHRRTDKRHPLIWLGTVYTAGQKVRARLRNISTHGALIQANTLLEPGTEATLDLGAAGKVDAIIVWSHDIQAGLAFRDCFELRRLADSRPEVAQQRWSKPEYLRDESCETSPWASEWGRLTLEELARRAAADGGFRAAQ